MKKKKREAIGRIFFKAVRLLVIVIVILGFGAGGYAVGYVKGVNEGLTQAGEDFSLFKLNVSSLLNQQQKPEVIFVEKKAAPEVREVPTWTGPELWKAVNKRRVELGVNTLANRSELCTVASIRLNELLEIDTLDGHEGFSKIPEEREDLRWIFEKYNMSEFLVSGAETPEQAVELWENTLGHRALLSGGEYVWGCIYAQNGFGVAIVAY